MDNDKEKGQFEQLKGKGKEFAGKATDNEKLKDEGKADQMKGKARETFGDVKRKVTGKD